MSTIASPIPVRETARQKAIPFLALLIVAPVFAVPAPGGFQLASPYSADLIGVTILPLSLVSIPLLLLLAPRLRLPAAASLPLLGLWLSAALGLTLGLLTPGAEGAADQRLLRFAQTVGPTLYFALGYGFVSALPDAEARHRAVAALLIWCALWVSGFTLLYTIDALLTGIPPRFGQLSDTIGPFVNPKMKRFFPMFMAVSAVVLVAAAFAPCRQRPLAKRWLAGLCALFLFAVLVQSWSRAALLAALAGLGILIWTRGLARSALGLAMAFMAAAVLISAVLLVPDLFGVPTALGRSIETLAMLTGTSDLDSGDAVRLGRIAMALEHGLFTPFGDGFRVRPQPNLDHGQMILAENGWLDLAVRSGLIGTLCVLFLVARPLPALLRSGRGPASDPFAPLLLAVWISIYGVGFFFLHLATELYFATLFWLLLGMVWATRQTNALERFQNRWIPPVRFGSATKQGLRAPDLIQSGQDLL